MPDHNDAADSGHRAGRKRARPRIFGAVFIGVLLLTVGVTLFGADLFRSDHPGIAQGQLTTSAELASSTVRVLPTPSLETAQVEDGEPTVVPASGRGTELFDSLPQQIGSFVLTDISATGIAGALEHYSGEYAVAVVDDGEVVPGNSSVKLTVSRWGTEAEATAQAERGRRAIIAASKVPTEIPVQARPRSGRAYGVAEAGNLTILWTDFTTTGTFSGGEEDVQELFKEFSLGAAIADQPDW